MFKEKRFYLILIFTLAIIFSVSQMTRAAYWQALPPYNLLWPLWSPLLSPPDLVTGAATPILTELSKTTILPMQPVLAYDPYWWTLAGPATGWPMGFQPPWLFYNGPTGLLFFDVLYGLNPFPPPKYVDPVTGAPIPISLLAGYSLIEPTTATLSVTKALYLFELGNLYYMLGYGSGLGVDPTSLLTLSDVWGLPAI